MQGNLLDRYRLKSRQGLAPVVEKSRKSVSSRQSLTESISGITGPTLPPSLRSMLLSSTLAAFPSSLRGNVTSSRFTWIPNSNPGHSTCPCWLHGWLLLIGSEHGQSRVPSRKLEQSNPRKRWEEGRTVGFKSNQKPLLLPGVTMVSMMNFLRSAQSQGKWEQGSGKIRKREGRKGGRREGGTKNAGKKEKKKKGRILTLDSCSTAWARVPHMRHLNGRQCPFQNGHRNVKRIALIKQALDTLTLLVSFVPIN